MYALENNLKLPIGPQESNLLDEFLDDEDLDQATDSGQLKLMLKEEQYFEQAGAVYDAYKATLEHRLDWIRAEFFKKELKQSLIEDARDLLKVLAIAQTWEADKDKQLKALHDLCTKKHAKYKILIFTQFADTA